jgi:CRISPR-associated protein Cas5d
MASCQQKPAAAAHRGKALREDLIMQSGQGSPLEVKVWGGFACFTRPEMKVERVSYPVMTPSAARGVLESIFWKPEFHWEVEEVWVLMPIRYFSILRNEINSRQTAQIARGWQREGGGFSATADRAQRHTLALRDVAYIIRARPMVREGVQEDPAKYRDQFRRRVRDGRCFATPYLGCREFSAWFSAPEGNEAPLEINEDLGNMLLRMDYLPGVSGSAIPQFFHAELKGGVLRVPKASPEEA